MFIEAEETRQLRLKLTLERMQNISHNYYHQAVDAECHAFIEFTGLMNEYIKLCAEALKHGKDYTKANVHVGDALPMRSYNADYIGEKIGCIFGPSLTPELFLRMVEAMELPFEVTVKEKPVDETQAS